MFCDKYFTEKEPRPWFLCCRVRLRFQIAFKNVIAILIWVIVIFSVQLEKILDYEGGCAKYCEDPLSTDCVYFQHMNRYICDLESYPDCGWFDKVNTEDDEIRLEYLYSDNYDASVEPEYLAFKADDFSNQNELDRTCTG